MHNFYIIVVSYKFMHEDLADFSLQYLKQHNADYAEARLETASNNSLILKNGILEASGFDITAGLGIRYVINGTLGFVSINEFHKDRIKHLMDKSLNITKASSKFGQKTGLSREKAYKAKYKFDQKIKFENVSPKDKIDLVKDFDNTIKELPARYISYSDTVVQKYFINTEGSKIESEIPMLSLYYFLTIGKKESLQIYHPYGGTGGYELFKKWDLLKKVPEDVKALKLNIEKGVKCPKGNFDLVLGPMITGIAVHESVGHPYEADRILGREAAQAGESFVTKDMINHQIGSNLVNVADDPTLQWGYGSYLYDDEGVKAGQRLLIKNGKINEFLQNRETAFDMNISSNGSSRANNYDKEAIVRMANTYMLPGSFNEDEIIKDVKNGIYIKTYNEWNIDDKRYQQKYVGNEAYLIKNGKITNPVKKPTLEITTPSFWKAVDAVGKKVEFFAGDCGKGEPMQGISVWMGGPMIRLKDIALK